MDEKRLGFETQPGTIQLNTEQWSIKKNKCAHDLSLCKIDPIVNSINESEIDIFYKK